MTNVSGDITCNLPVGSGLHAPVDDVDAGHLAALESRFRIKQVEQNLTGRYVCRV